MVAKVGGYALVVNLISNYKAFSWKLDEALLRRQITHVRKTKNFPLTFRQARLNIVKQVRTAQTKKQLPRLTLIPWINQALLNPQTLLQYGKERLRRIQQTNLGLAPSVTPDNLTDQNLSDFTLRLSNIRSLTKEKLNIDRATESLLRISPDAYIYVESRFDPSESTVSRYRQVFHSSQEDGQGGTTVLIKKDAGVSFSEVRIPDTVILVIHKGRNVIILAGTYQSHRLTNKSQRITMVLDTITQLAGKFISPTILIFGDLNMSERTARNTIDNNAR